MGVEDFQVVIKYNGKNKEFNETIQFIKSCQNVFVDYDTKQISNEQYYIFDDSKHIIELEISQREANIIKISCRFAVCHPISIDNVFIELIIIIAKKLKSKIEILDETPNGDPYQFFYPEYEKFETVLKKTIEIKRNYWMQDFGSETASLRTSEAIKKYILSKCL